MTVTDVSTTCAVVIVETAVTVTNNSSIQDYVHLDDHTAVMLYLLIMKLRLTPLFKPFTIAQHTIYVAKNKKRITIYKLLHHLPDCSLVVLLFSDVSVVVVGDKVEAAVVASAEDERLV